MATGPLNHILSYLDNHAGDILADVKMLVEIESPSNYKDGIDRVLLVAQDWLTPMGQLTRHPGEFGDVLHARIPGNSNDRVVLLGHVDTVYPLSSWNELWAVKREHAFGPGIYDMKAGIVQALWSLRSIDSAGEKPFYTVDLLLTPDEEIGSYIGRPFIEKLAKGSKAVLVLEAPYMNGDLKIARKGVGDYKIQVHGKAAHQGLEPQNGRNAIISAAHLITQLVKIQDLEKGTTLGPNVIHGGTVSNVVADHAMIEIDLRIWSKPEAERVDAELRALQPLKGTSYEITGGLNRPPMEPSEGSFELLKKAQKLANEIGFSLGAARVGGGSDGNFTSTLAATLDGFGAVGAHAHQRDLEHIHIPSLAPRAALLAGMLLKED